ncbi:MAG: hypothetical protein LLG44_06820 [Chloroflexi bacterium]|nr:hypothetical protein [Chloroflexota bacterium]
MKPVVRVLLAVILVSTIAVAAVGCKKANPEEEETKRIAQEFALAVFVTRDPDAAMALAVPLTGFGYVTKEAIESTILNDKQKQCTTKPESVQVGAPGANLKVPEVTDADRAKGITDRVLWVVGYSYRCGTQTRDTARTTQVFLEKVNGKWGISKCTF